MAVRKRIIKEDIGFSSDKTRIRVKDNVVKTGGRYKLPPERLVLRRPTKEEIAAGTNPSDYQIGQLRIFSKVLFDFGLISRVFRSKVSSITKSNTRQLDKYRQIFHTFLGNFNANEPVQNVRNVLALVKDETFEAADIVGVLRATNDWQSESELLQNLSTGYKELKSYSGEIEPSNDDIQAVKSVYVQLSNIINTEMSLGHDKKQITNAITYANNVNGLMEDDLYMADAEKLVYTDTAVQNVSDLEAEVNSYMAKVATGTKTGHSNTILHDEARRNLQILALKIKNDGYEGGLTTTNVFDYLKANEPEVIQHVSQTYNIPEEDLSGEHFPTWESLAQFFYSPEMIRKIDFEQLGVKNRARTSGDIRMGSLLTNDAKSAAARKKTLEKKIQAQKDKAPTLEELEEQLKLQEQEHEEAKKIRDDIEQQYHEAQESEDQDVIDDVLKAYNASRVLVAKISKKITTLRKKIKKYKEDEDAAGVNKEDIEDLRKLQAEVKHIFDKARGTLDDNADTREFEKIIDKIDKIERKEDAAKFDPKEIDYYTWSFVVNSTRPAVIKCLQDNLKKGLELYNKYINISTFEPEYEGLVGTEFVIDYPRQSRLYKALKKDPEFAYKIMDALMTTVLNELKIRVKYYDDEEYVHINEEF